MTRPRLRLVTASLVLGASPALAAAPDPAATDPAAYVNPFVGTQDGGTDFGHGGGAGMTFPGAAVPFGMLQWSPDTVRLAGGGYKYEDDRLRGFSLTHLSGPGCASAQDFPVIPISGSLEASPAVHPEGFYLPFRHENEEASPGYYAVALDSGVRVELTATTRAGVGRFTFPPDRPGTLLLAVTGSINGADDGEGRVAGTTVSGWVKTGGFCGTPQRYSVHFHATFDRPFEAVRTWKGESVRREETGGERPGEVIVRGPGSGISLQFDTRDGRPVHMHVGLSYVSVEGAAANRREEVEGKTFEAVRRSAREAWNERLGQVAVRGGTEDERRTFYTALYHSLHHPHVFEDVDRRYLGFDSRTHAVSPGRHHYATVSGWDVYRTQVQLLALLAPDVAADVAQSLLDDTKARGGVWDRWSHQNSITGVMNGDPYHSILASLYAFGARAFDAEGALEAMVAGAERLGRDPATGYEERPGNADYRRLGYVPGDVSTTLEYAVADFGIAQLARRLGRTEIHAEFASRSLGWRRTYNPASGWLQPRFADGSFLTPFDPGRSAWYVEGNGAQYHWMVPHDVATLFGLMGGRDEAVRRLDEFFAELNAGSERPHAYLGNEPSLVAPWLYVWAGAPHRTQDVVRRAQQRLYKPTPGGLVGNDDLGTLSAWYVWAALGLYPAIPGRAELILGSPTFEWTRIRRSSGQVITVEAPGASETHRYVQRLEVDGRVAGRAWLPESFVAEGGTLRYVLGPEPNRRFGSRPEDAPPSFGAGEGAVAVAVEPGLASVAPGGTLAATLRVQTLGGRRTLRWSARPPEGVEVVPASGALDVEAGRPASRSLEVRVAPDRPLGVVAVPLEIAESGMPVPPALRLNVARPGTVEWHATNAGIADESDPGRADFDNGGWTYSAQALSAAGATPGAVIRWNGFAFHWPDRRAGDLDNVEATGQAIELPGAPEGATALAFLGSGANGDARASVTVAYDDGSSRTAPLEFGDWVLAEDAYPPRFGNEIVLRLPYRLRPERRHWVNTYVFAAVPVELDPTKRVRSLTLHPAQGGVLHVFAWALR